MPPRTYTPPRRRTTEATGIEAVVSRLPDRFFSPSIETNTELGSGVDTPSSIRAWVDDLGDWLDREGLTVDTTEVLTALGISVSMWFVEAAQRKKSN